MKNHALFNVIFEDGSFFVGGVSFFKTKWLEIPDKKIKRIFFRLPDGNHICFDSSNYDEYYYKVEATRDWMKVSRSKIQVLDNTIPKLECFYIMAKKDNKITSYRISLFQSENSKYKVGDITRREFDINNEKIKGLNPNGWKS
jgi:hypothetical protein